MMQLMTKIRDKYAFIFDNINPSSQITLPTNNAMISTLPNISGSASDATAGVSNVKVTILNVTDNKYWTGSNWQSSGSDVFLNVTSGTTAWYFTSPTWTSPANYLVKSKSTDATGNVESVGVGNSFTVDTTAPSSSIIAPANIVYLSGLNTITGTSEDPAPGSGIGSVKLKIYSIADTTYWTGSTWTSNENWVIAGGTTSYSYAAPGWTSGNDYIVTSRAVDTASNEESPGVSNTWTFDNTKPSSGVTLPSNGAILTALPTISGSALDNKTGVTNVQVRIKKASDTTYWTGSTWLGSEQWLAATGETYDSRWCNMLQIQNIL